MDIGKGVDGIAQRGLQLYRTNRRGSDNNLGNDPGRAGIHGGNPDLVVESDPTHLIEGPHPQSTPDPITQVRLNRGKEIHVSRKIQPAPIETIAVLQVNPSNLGPSSPRVVSGGKRNLFPPLPRRRSFRGQPTWQPGKSMRTAYPVEVRDLLGDLE